jgi:hypothetical protein
MRQELELKEQALAGSKVVPHIRLRQQWSCKLI